MRRKDCSGFARSGQSDMSDSGPGQAAIPRRCSKLALVSTSLIRVIRKDPRFFIRRLRRPRPLADNGSGFFNAAAIRRRFCGCRQRDVERTGIAESLRDGVRLLPSGMPIRSMSARS